MSDYTPACYAMFKDGKIEYSEMCVSGCADDFDMSDYPEDEGFEVVALYSEDAIATLQARVKELEGEKADFHMTYRMKCDEETKRLEARIAALESGQPCEVNGVMGQWLPEIQPDSVIQQMREVLGEHVEDTNSDYRRIYARLLTASAAEMKEQTK